MSSNSDVFTNKPPDTPIIITTMEQTAPTAQPAQLHQVGKHQMLPLVVIQAQPSQKLSTAVTNSNMITIPQILPMQQVNNQMVIGKTPIVLQKAGNLPKNGVTYLTMLKPVSKPPDSVLSAARLPITTISKLKGAESTMQLLNNQKIMITPMPSVTTNRLPVTMTTNSVQSKISFMPLVQGLQSVQGNAKSKIINFKIADNAVKKEDLAKFVDLATSADLTITAVPEDKKKTAATNDVAVATAGTASSTATPSDALDERSYQLSIVENDPEEDKKDLKLNAMPIHGVSILKRSFPFGAKAIEKTTPPTPDTTAILVPASTSITSTTSQSKSTIKFTPTPNDTIFTISDPTTKEVQIRAEQSSVKVVADLIPIPAIPASQAAPHAASISKPECAPAAKVDATKKEVKQEASDAVISTPVTTLPPAKRSRKSTLCLRKDFHDIELQVSTKCNELKKLDLDEERRYDMEVDAINAGADPFNFSSLLDEEFIKIFDWKQSVGKLPGSNLKFFVNEFGFLEYLTQDEFNRMHLEGKTKKAEERLARKQAKIKKEMTPAEEQEEMRCLECGCYGMASEFINPKYCSMDCHANGEKKAVNDPANNNKKKRHFLGAQSQPVGANGTVNTSNSQSQTSVTSAVKKRKCENGDRDRDREHAQSSDDDASIRTDASHEKYPWHCRTKGFSWSKYLAHINAIGAPVKLFKDAFPYNRNGFRPGMKLEGIDPSHPSYFCVMTVAQVQGYRLLLHFDGYPKSYDIWVNSDSMDIFPAGFCEKHEHTLHPPPNFPNFNWISYLKHTKATIAPKHLFSNRNGSAIFPTAFRVGMKLEAVDRKNTSLVCVATAKDLMDSRILVHFDSWDDIYDYWADPSSPYIHPVGWCDKNGHSLTPPNDYPDPANFTWEKYLKETSSAAAPVRAFKQRPPSGFKKGMRLECVDKRVPQLIRVASVVEVKNHRLRVAFDGWPDRYAYWVDDDNPDIHPVGWCQKTGHPLEPPLTPDDVYDLLECATIGCRGIGNMKGPGYSTHSSLKYCPYAEDNIDIDSLLPDRLLSPDRELEAVVPVSREPKTKRAQKKNAAAKTEWTDTEVTDTTPTTNSPDERGNNMKIKSSNSTPAPSPSPAPSLKSVSTIKKESSIMPDEISVEEVNMRNKHSKYLKTYAKYKTHPAIWTIKKVVDYVQSLPFAKHNADAFTQNAIDGESFLMLTQEDLVDVLDYKLGPAIALYNCILLLRQSANGT